MKIFIASTVHDLKDTRSIIKEALEKWKIDPILSEFSDTIKVATKVDSYTACVKAVKETDCLILIIDKSYGGIVPIEIILDLRAIDSKLAQCPLM